MKISIKLASLFFLSFTLLSCSSAEGLIGGNCVSSGIPEPVCTCTYEELSKSYSDSEIKELYTEMEKVDAGMVRIPSKETRAFAINMGKALQQCLAKY